MALLLAAMAALIPLLAALSLVARRARRTTAPALAPAQPPPAALPPAPALAPYVGRPVGGYLLERVLGAGSSATVYLARHIATQHLLALKILHPHRATTPAQIAAFLAEARVANSIAHPAVPRAYEARLSDDGLAFIAMEHIEGSTLADILAREEQADTSPTTALARSIALLHILDACQRAGVTPLDLSPYNILLDAHGAPHLIDQGLVKLAGQPTLPQGTIAGSAGHMSPEQANGDIAAIDARSLVWTTAALTYRMLTGQRPHEAPDDDLLLQRTRNRPVRSIAHLADLPPGLSAAIDRALALAPSARFSTLADFRAALETELALLLHERRATPRGRTRRYDAAAFTAAR